MTDAPATTPASAAETKPADAPAAELAVVEPMAALTRQKVAVSVVEYSVSVGAVNDALVSTGFAGVATMTDVLTLLGLPLPPY